MWERKSGLDVQTNDVDDDDVGRTQNKLTANTAVAGGKAGRHFAHTMAHRHTDTFILDRECVAYVC